MEFVSILQYTSSHRVDMRKSLCLTPVDLQVDDRVVNDSEETGDFDDDLRNLEALLDEDTDMPAAT
jgi:hypothetical protein